MRKEGSAIPLHVLHPDLSPDEIAMLEQLPGVHCIQARSQHAMFQKPEALLSADTTWVTWIDSDVLWRGDLSPLISGDEPGIQIRIRAASENANAFSAEAGTAGSASGAIPAHILGRWRDDVGEEKRPRFDRMAVSNAIALHRDYRWLPERWHTMMEQVSKNPGQLVDRANTAYRITDEAALTAVLMYCHDEVPILPYRLNQDPERILIHFAGSPKPWQGWQLRYVNHYHAVATTVQWGKDNGLEMPPTPPSMALTNESRYQFYARMHDVKSRARQTLIRGVRAIHSRP